MTYSELIKKIRKSFDMNMRTFGKKVNLSFSTISLLEKGYRGKSKTPIIPLIDTLKQICQKTHYPFRQFLEETGYIEPMATVPSLAVPETVARLWNQIDPALHDAAIKFMEGLI